MRSGKFLYLIILGVILYFGYQFLMNKTETNTIEYNSALIEKQIKNVGKLVVTEGHFSEVLTYKDQKKYFMDLLSFEKKALMVVNTDVTVAYDLSKLKYKIDQENQTLTLLFIPKEEIKINPNIQFYNIEASTFNPFEGEDYNKINKKVRKDLAIKIEQSTLKSNAKNRLISELAKILILTNSMGWKLIYEGKEISNEENLNQNVLN
ncbi:MAG: DUF4230 domain-containing protein [Flavobacterium sp.]